MVATITGNTPFHDLTSTTGITISANLSALSTGSDAIGDHIRVTNSDNELGSVSIDIQGTNPVDLTNKYIITRLAQNNDNRPNDYYLGFLDSSGNERRYTVFTTASSQAKDVVLVFDLTLTADVVNDPGFDQTDVTTVVWYTDKNGGGVNSSNRLYSIEYIDQLVITGGTVSDPIDNSDIRSALGGLADFEDDGLEQPRALDDYLSFQHNLKIGDGVSGSTYYDPPPGGLIARQNLPYSNAEASALHYTIIQIADALKRVEFDLADAQTIDGQTYTRKVFVNSSAAVITWEGTSFVNCQSIQAGTGILTRALISNTSGELSTTGSIVNSSIVSDKSSGAVLELGVGGSISGTPISIDGADYHLELADGVTNITLADVEFLGTPGVNKVHVLTTTGTVLITTTGTTNLSPSDVTSDGATVTVSVPSVSFSAPNLTSSVFNQVRVRLSLVLDGPIQFNDDNTVSSGGSPFLPSDVNITNNTITIAGASGKVSSASGIRVYGSDLPAPLDSVGIYYPSVDYDGSDNISLASSPNGPTIDLTSTGTVPAEPDLYMAIWTELDNSLVASGSYTVDLAASASTAGVTLANDDVLTLQAIHHDVAGTGGTAVISEYLETSFQYSGASITTLENLRQATLTMQLIQELGLDGSQVTGYTFDPENPAKIQIDIAKTTINTLELLAFYYYVQSTEAGMRFARGNVLVENANKIALYGQITFDAQVTAVMTGPYIYRVDGKTWQADTSATITQFVEDTRALVLVEEKPVDLAEEVLQAINALVHGVGYLVANNGGGGSLTATQSEQLQTLFDATTDGAGDTVFSTTALANASSSATGANQTTIINHLQDIKGAGFDTATDNLEAIRDNCETATGFSTHSAADVWAVDSAAYAAIVTAVWTATTRELTSITPAQLSAIATSVEAALINEGDGQQLIDAIVNVINTNLDLPAVEIQLIASAVRSELTTELARIDTEISSRQPDGVVTVGGYGSGLAPNELITGYSLETTSQQILTRANSLPLLADMEGSTPLTTVADVSGLSTFNPANTSVTVGGYGVGLAPNELITGYALQTTSLAISTALDTLPTLADMEGSSSLTGVADTTTLSANIGLILGHTRPMAKQLGLVSGVSATHSESSIVVSDGDGTTTITDNGDGSYTVSS